MSGNMPRPPGHRAPMYLSKEKYLDPTGGKPLGKPLGMDLQSQLNGTYMGPGKKYIHWALFVFGLGAIFMTVGATYTGLRCVSRIIVYRTEFIGPFFIIAAVVCLAIIGKLVNKARLEGNKWRASIRFRGDGLRTVSAYHLTYQPEELHEGLKSGTETEKAIKQVRKGRRGGGGRSRAGSDASMRSARSTRSARSAGRRGPRPAGPPGTYGVPHGMYGGPPSSTVYSSHPSSAGSMEKIPLHASQSPAEIYNMYSMPQRGPPLMHPGRARVMGMETDVRVPLYREDAADSSV